MLALPVLTVWLLGAYFLGLHAAHAGASLRRPVAWVNLLLWPLSLPAWLLRGRRQP